MGIYFSDFQYFISWEFIQHNHFIRTTLDEEILKVIDFCQEYINHSEDFCFELLTSGSTGTPKKITISKKKMKMSALSTIQKLQLEKEKDFLICLSTDYIAGKMMLVRAIESNANVKIIAPKQHIWEDIEAFYFAAIVPVQLKSLLDNKNSWEKYKNIHALIVGGATIPSEWLATIEQLPMPIYATFGMTETVSHFALQLLNTQKKQDYFEVLENTSIQKNKNECLEIKSEITDNQWITTNDTIELISPSQFKWLGRIDNVINIGGKKIQPETIENSISLYCSHYFENEAFFVVGIDDEKWGEKIVLYVETNNAWDISKIDSFLTKIAIYLPHSEVPKAIIFEKKFERTNTGKIKRNIKKL